MQVKDVMTRTVEVISPHATLAAAAGRMSAFNVGLLAVQHEQALLGVITDRDITVRAIAHGLDPTTSHVRDVMAPGVLACLDDQTVGDALGKMRAYRTSRLLVLDRAQQLVGSVSLDDLAVSADTALPAVVGQKDGSRQGHGHQFQRILVALDGSAFAERILPLVESVARQFDSTITLLHALEAVPELVPAELSVGVIDEDRHARRTAAITDDMRQHAGSYLVGVRRTLEARGLKVDLDCAEGDASQAILRRAQQLEADVIAITTHGRTGVDRTLFGSVAEEVLRRAPCPVLLVRVHDGR